MLCLSLSLSRARSLFRSLSRALSLALTHTLSHPLSHTHSLSHTQTHTHTPGAGAGAPETMLSEAGMSADRSTRFAVGGTSAWCSASTGCGVEGVSCSTRKVDVRLPGKGNSNSHGARPIHQIITMIWWIRTSRLSIKNSLCSTKHTARDEVCCRGDHRVYLTECFTVVMQKLIPTQIRQLILHIGHCEG